MKNFANQRVDYESAPIDIPDLINNPLAQLSLWLSNAIDLGLPEANAMTLSTVSSEGVPSSRTVLCKEITDTGLIFFTNYESRKSKEMDAISHVAITFTWLETFRQINIRGKATRCSAEVSDSYWVTRSSSSQAASAASKQSQVLSSKEKYLEEVKKLENGVSGKALPRPDYWGGWHVEALEFEFWQGGPSRMHDRFLYHKFDQTKSPGSQWLIKRLYP